MIRATLDILMIVNTTIYLINKKTHEHLIAFLVLLYQDIYYVLLGLVANYMNISIHTRCSFESA